MLNTPREWLYMLNAAREWLYMVKKLVSGSTF